MKLTNNRYDGGAKIKNDINIIPFVDIMLVLLVFFMVNPASIMSNIKVTLPQVTTDSAQEENTSKERFFLITVERDGKMFLSNPTIGLIDEPVDPSSMIDYLSGGKSAHPTTKLYIQADHKTQYDFIVRVMEAGKNSGYEHINLVNDTNKKGD